MKYTYGIGEMLDDGTCLMNNGKEQIMIKNGIAEFKRVLNESVDAVWNLGSDLDELVMIEWEDENSTFLNTFFTQRVFLEHENRLLKSTLEYHTSNLKQLNKQLQNNIDDNKDDEQIYNDIDMIADYLFRVIEDLEEVLPKVKAEIAIKKYGFDKSEVDKLECLFKDV